MISPFNLKQNKVNKVKKVEKYLHLKAKPYKPFFYFHSVSLRKFDLNF